MKDEPTGAHNYQILLSRFTSSGQWDRVLETAREWLSHDPEETAAHMGAAQALINLKRYADAERHLTRVVAANPDNDVAHRFMANIHFNQNRFKAADESIQRALSLDPNDAHNWFYLAWMAYKQGDPASARKYAEKSRELAPRNADIINLLALCNSRDPAQKGRTLEEYRKALELEPENAQVHNNIGVYQLNVGKNYADAEACFRRALFFNPALKVARSNLFIAIKHRDRVYRLLCAPRDGIYKMAAFMRARRKDGWFLYLGLTLLWILLFRFALGVLILWFALVWPMLKTYEYLTVGDIRAQAGEIGARRGGLFGYRQWPLRLRLSILALLLLFFWGAIALFAVGAQAGKLSDNGQALLGLLMFAGVMVFICIWIYAKAKRMKAAFWARRRAKKVEHLLESESGE